MCVCEREGSESMCGSSACILACKLFSLYFIIHVSCMIVQVISSVGLEANQGVERVLNWDIQTVQQNLKCHNLCVGQNISQNVLKEKTILSKWNQNITRNLQLVFIVQICQQGLNWVHVWNFCFFVRYEPPVRLPHCYYGKWATRLTSKPAAFIFISPSMLRIQTVINLQQMWAPKINRL